MGQLTRTQIVTQGMLLAGRDDLASVVNVDFNAWLRSVYMGWPWTFLKAKKTALSLVTGATSVAVGGGSGGVTLGIQKILQPILVYNSTNTTRFKADIQQLTGGGVEWDETVNPSATWRGIPQKFKVQQRSTWGSWDLIPAPFPDKDYLLTFYYLAQPADIDTTSSGDSTVPIYPNDRTMIQACMAQTLLYKEGADDSSYRAALDVLDAQVINDRVKYGAVPGDNDLVQLDSSVFR